MVEYIPIEQRMLEALAEFESIKHTVERHQADIDYIAMMTDVELEAEEDENEPEISEG